MLFLNLVQRAQTVVSGVKNIVPVRYSSFLGRLAPNDGATHRVKRLGRGPSSDLGKTSGRGQKGQKARGKVPYWFEGGQTPFYKRFPKTGFSRANKLDLHQLNLERIQDFWNHGRIPLKEGETLTIHHMRKCGLITGSLKDGVKILGNGKEEYNVPLNIEATKGSESAIKRIESLNYEFTAVYRTRLGLRAHISPNHFLRTRGYVPLQARPTHKRDIAYYSDKAKRGYLLKDRSLLLDFIGKRVVKEKRKRVSSITNSLSNASTSPMTDFSKSKTISFADL